MRVLIADGGTGGHIFPALAIAEELKSRPGVDAILFTGTPSGLESDLVPMHNHDLRMVHVGGLIGKNLMTKVKTLMQLPFAYLESRRILSEFRPDLAIGFGAYASGPVLVAAHHKGVPVLLVEPNAIPGFTNRKALAFAAAVAIPYEDSEGIYKGKAVVTGTPSRSLQRKKIPHEKFTLGVFGGSQGSRALNQTVIAALPDLVKIRNRFHLIHQTGKMDFEMIKNEYDAKAPFYQVMPFIYDVEEFFGRCDLLLCRAGAITLAEITALGIPAILVPLPTAAHNHQEQNARRLAEKGAARLILQKDFTPEALVTTVEEFVSFPDRLEAMGEAARSMGKPNATKQVADLALKLIELNHRGTKAQSEKK